MRSFRALWVLLAALAASPARADEAPGRDGAPPEASRRVTVVLVGEPRTRAGIEVVLRELFARLPVDLEIQLATSIDLQAVLTPPASAAPRLARIWIDGRGAQRATIFLVDGPWERVLVRHVPLRGGLDEVAREEVAHIAETSVGALLGGGRIGVTRAEARADLGVPTPTPKAPPPPAPPPPTRSPVHLLGGYSVEAWSSAAPVRHGPTLGVALHLPVDAAPGRFFGVAEVLVSYRLPNTVDEQPVGARLQHAVVRVAGGPFYRLSERWSLGALAGGGFDVAIVAPRTEPGSGFELHPSTYRTSALGSASLAAGFRASPALRFIGQLGADFDLLDTRYVIDVGGTVQPIIVPWRVRGVLTLGVEWVL
jgi:hypothetical protein